MKKIIFFLSMVFVVSCCTQKPAMVLKSDYMKLQDSIQGLNTRIDSMQVQSNILNDSIEDLLVRPMMTSEQFIDLYNYYSLRKYYLICKKNPSQWKYYKGWSSQVFEQ